MSNKLPRAALDAAVPGEDYPFKIILRGEDVPDVDVFTLVFKSGGSKHIFDITPKDVPADDTQDPPLASGKELSGDVPATATARWYEQATWLLYYRDGEKRRPLIGGTLAIEFPDMM